LNFRYSCTFCNSKRKDVRDGTSGGKADRFPLLDERARVYSEAPIDGEDPALLDPCELEDWQLLGCRRENGESCPATADDTEQGRVNTSIDVYYLNYEPSCKQRHSAAVKLLTDIELAKALFLESHADPRKRRRFKEAAKNIMRAIQRTAPYSGEMIFLVRGQRHSDHPWIQDLLET
jgi:hypothetical protein